MNTGPVFELRSLGFVPGLTYLAVRVANCPCALPSSKLLISSTIILSRSSLAKLEPSLIPDREPAKHKKTVNGRLQVNDNSDF